MRMYYKPSGRTLLNYIPIGAPATRRPAGDEERRIRVSFGFIPKWYVERVGISFGREWHENCEYRYDTLTRMKAYLNKRFPSVEEFCPRDNGKGFDEDCATLSGAYGSKVLAMLYGFEVRFPEDDWPVDASAAHLSKEKLTKLTCIDLENNPFMHRLDEQMNHMERVFGRVDGFLNYQGVLNTAQKLRGNEIFMDMTDDEAFIDGLFGNIEDTIEKAAKRVQARQRLSGCDIDLLSLSNCVVNMISPNMYERFVLPHDKALSEKFRRFGVHTCNWNVTPYLQSLRQIDDLGYLDMGSMSDMRLARRIFPETRLAVLYSPVAFAQKPLAELEADLRAIAEQAVPCDIVLADLTEDTDDARLSHILKYIGGIEANLE